MCAQGHAARIANIEHPFEHTDTGQRTQVGQKYDAGFALHGTRADTNLGVSRIGRRRQIKAGRAAFHHHFNAALWQAQARNIPAGSDGLQRELGAFGDRHALRVQQPDLDGQLGLAIGLGGGRSLKDDLCQGSGRNDLDFGAGAANAKAVNFLQLHAVDARTERHRYVLPGFELLALQAGTLADALFLHRLIVHGQDQARALAALDAHIGNAAGQNLLILQVQETQLAILAFQCVFQGRLFVRRRRSASKRCRQHGMGQYRSSNCHGYRSRTAHRGGKVRATGRTRYLDQGTADHAVALHVAAGIQATGRGQAAYVGQGHRPAIRGQAFVGAHGLALGFGLGHDGITPGLHCLEQRGIFAVLHRKIGLVPLAFFQIQEQTIGLARLARVYKRKLRALRQRGGVEPQRVGHRTQAVQTPFAFDVGHHPGAVFQKQAHARNAGLGLILKPILVAVHKHLAKGIGFVCKHAPRHMHAGIGFVAVKDAGRKTRTGPSAVDGIRVNRRAHTNAGLVAQGLRLTCCQGRSAGHGKIEDQIRAYAARRIGSAHAAYPGRPRHVAKAGRQLVLDGELGQG